MRLVVSGLRVALSDFDVVVDRLDVSGDAIAFVGASGSGKTTLLECVAGLRCPEGGRIELDGAVLFDAAAGIDLPPRERGLGYATQDDTLFPHLSARQNLRFGAVAEDAGEDVATALGLLAHLDRAPRALSGGERRRLLAGRALLAARRAVLLDEPAAGLDEETAARVSAAFGELRRARGLPLLLVTHDEDDARRTCGAFVRVARGRAFPGSDAA